MNVFIDSNVLFSAALFPGSTPAIEIAFHGSIVIRINKKIICFRPDI